MTKKEPRVKKNNSARYKAWTLMRILQKFTMSDIIELADIKKENIRVFFRFLLRAKFIRKKKDGTFFLLRNDGPAVPVVLLKEKLVYEPNTKKYFDEKGERKRCLNT